MPITIADIAKEAGVSRATVSGVLNNNPNVSTKTRERISAIIKKYNFTPNAVARALALQHTGLIGLIIKDISNPLYSKISLGVEQVCEKEGYSVIIGNTHTDIDREVAYMDLLKQRRVDGLIIFPAQRGVHVGHLQELLQQKLPFVLLANVPGIDTDLVRCDDEGGAFAAVQQFIRSGRKKLIYISGPGDFLASDRRLNGFRRALGLPLGRPWRTARSPRPRPADGSSRRTTLRSGRRTAGSPLRGARSAAGRRTLRRPWSLLGSRWASRIVHHAVR